MLSSEALPLQTKLAISTYIWELTTVLLINDYVMEFGTIMKVALQQAIIL